MGETRCYLCRRPISVPSTGFVWGKFFLTADGKLFHPQVFRFMRGQVLIACDVPFRSPKKKEIKEVEFQEKNYPPV